MFFKFVFLTAFVVSTLAIESQEANSLLYNDNYNSVQHIQSVPTIVKVGTSAPIYAAQAAPVYASQVAKVAIPAAVKYVASPAYLTASGGPLYSRPSFVNYAAPSVTTYVNAPASASPVYAAAPVTNVATVTYNAPVPNLVAAPTHSAHQEEYAHPRYQYAYSVEDHHTGDLHSQQEERDGDHVVGQYSLHEADGTIRVVKYFDDGHGFNAIVEKQGTATEAPVLKNVVVPVVASHY